MPEVRIFSSETIPQTARDVPVIVCVAMGYTESSSTTLTELSGSSMASIVSGDRWLDDILCSEDTLDRDRNRAVNTTARDARPHTVSPRCFRNDSTSSCWRAHPLSVLASSSRFIPSGDCRRTSIVSMVKWKLLLCKSRKLDQWRLSTAFGGVFVVLMCIALSPIYHGSKGRIFPSIDFEN